MSTQIITLIGYVLYNNIFLLVPMAIIVIAYKKYNDTRILWYLVFPLVALCTATWSAITQTALRLSDATSLINHLVVRGLYITLVLSLLVFAIKDGLFRRKKRSA